MKLTKLAVGGAGAVLAGLGALSLVLIAGHGEVAAKNDEANEQQHELQLMLELSVQSSKLLQEALTVAVFDTVPEAIEGELLPEFDEALGKVAELAGEVSDGGEDEGGDHDEGDAHDDAVADGAEEERDDDEAEEAVFFGALAHEARRLRREALALLHEPAPQREVRLSRAAALQDHFDDSVLTRLQEGIREEVEDAVETRASQEAAMGWLRMVSIVGPITLFLALALALALWLPRFIRRMRALETAALEIGAGSLQGEIAISGNDELTDLARAFNKMSGDLRRASQFLRDVYKAMPGGLIIVDCQGVIEAVNDETLKLLGYADGELVGRPVSMIFAPDEVPDFSFLQSPQRVSAVVRTENVCRTKDDLLVPVLFSATQLPPSGAQQGACGVVCVALDIRDRKKLELELRQAQKLESVGRLAAGVAHEINTPIQFVNDSVAFVKDAASDLADVIGKHRALSVAVAAGQPTEEMLEDARQKEDDVDLDYLLEHVPLALSRAHDGLDRIATIVRSMKEFAHPDRQEMTTVDLNRAILATLTIAHSEYKLVADAETDLGDIPLVTCHAGEVNQALLNIVVNAAHAVGDAVAGSGTKGRIKVATRVDKGDVVIAISDTGGGIPLAVRERIFDPFFTTKEVGKGTGQGLAVAHSVICQKHRGRIDFESELGKGTTFFLRLPVSPPKHAAPLVLAA